MAMTMIFDTLQYAKKAKEVGFTEAQAEFQAEEIGKIFNEKVATKKDIKHLEERIKETEERIIDKMTVRFGSMLAAAVVLMPVLMNWIK